MSNQSNSFVIRLLRFRWLIVLLLPVVIFLASGTAKNIYYAHSPDMWFLEDNPVNQSYQKLNKEFGDNQYLIIGISNKNGDSVIMPESLESVRQLHAFLEEQPEVSNVESLANYQYLRSKNGSLSINDLLNEDVAPFELASTNEEADRISDVLKHEPIIINNLVTNDLKHTALVAETFYEPGGRLDQQIALVNKVEDYIKTYNFDEKGVKVTLFGRPYISKELTGGNVKDQMLFFPFLLLVIITIFTIVFRKFIAVIAPVSVIFMSLLASYGFQGALGWPTTVASASVPFLIVILGTVMSMYFVMEYYQTLLHEPRSTNIEAAAKSIKHLKKPLLFTTFTTVLGFVGLSMTNLIPLRQFGIIASFGVVFCMLISMIYLPALLSFSKSPSKKFTKKYLNKGEKFWVANIVIWSMKNAKAVTVGFVVIFLGAIVATSSLKMDTNFVQIFKKDSEFRAAFNYFDEVFQGGQSLDLMLEAGGPNAIFDPEFMQSADEIGAYLDAYPELGKPQYVLDYLKQMNVSMHNDDENYRVLPSSREEAAQLLLLYENSGPERNFDDMINSDRSIMRITLRAQNMSAIETRALVDGIKADIHNKWPAVNVEITGELELFNELESHIAKGMVLSFAISLLSIALALLVLFRNFRSTLLALLPSVFPIFVGGAVMKLLGIYPDINALIVASITIGIAVDDSIHLLTRYQDGRNIGMSIHVAAVNAANSVGRAMFLSSAILVLGLSVFLFSSLQSGVNFGILSISVIVSAFLADIIVLPALITVTLRKYEPAGDQNVQLA